MACTQSESPVNQCGSLAQQTQRDGGEGAQCAGVDAGWLDSLANSQGGGGGRQPGSQAVVMAMTASRLTALGLSHIRHSVKLLFAIAIKGGRGGGG